MRVAWVPVVLGAGLTLGGLWFLWQGWVQVVSGGVTASGVASLGAGTLLALLGSVMFIAPLLVPVLYRIYGERAFTSRGGACPVVARCARCGEFNFRGRPQCKGCTAPLVWEAQS
jgi:hypothetical protein